MECYYSMSTFNDVFIIFLKDLKILNRGDRKNECLIQKVEKLF